MSTLDPNLQFHQLSSDIQAAFVRSEATKTTLSKNTLLYRFSGGPYLSPWWTEKIYLHDFLYKAKESKVPFYQYIRNATAVLRKWDKNGTGYLVIAALKEDLTAFKGSISSQNEEDAYKNQNNLHYKGKYTKPVFFHGGGSQVYIPRLYVEQYKGADKEMERKNQEEIKEVEWKYLSFRSGIISIYDNDMDAIIKMSSF